jgi:hypothetical protein
MASELGRAPGRPAGPAALLMPVGWVAHKAAGPAGLRADLWVHWAASRLLWLSFFFFFLFLYYLQQNIILISICFG